MNAAVVVLILSAVFCAVASAFRDRPIRKYPRHTARLIRRLLRRRRGQAAIQQALELARAFLDGRPDPIANLAAGIILQPGEHGWLQVRARLAVRSSLVVCPAPATGLGQHPKKLNGRIRTEAWKDRGVIDWFITSQRMVGRPKGRTEMISIWWSGLAGLDIDLKHERVVFNALNGWTGVLTGATVTPIAVAAIAACHGHQGLLFHPALEKFRQHTPAQSPVPVAAATQGGATIIQLPTRRPPA